MKFLKLKMLGGTKGAATAIGVIAALVVAPMLLDFGGDEAEPAPGLQTAALTGEGSAGDGSVGDLTTLEVLRAELPADGWAHDAKGTDGVKGAERAPQGAQAAATAEEAETPEQELLAVPYLDLDFQAESYLEDDGAFPLILGGASVDRRAFALLPFAAWGILAASADGGSSSSLGAAAAIGGDVPGGGGNSDPNGTGGGGGNGGGNGGNGGNGGGNGGGPGTSPVPEPGAALLFAVGAAVVGRSLRRRA